MLKPLVYFSCVSLSMWIKTLATGKLLSARDAHVGSGVRLDLEDQDPAAVLSSSLALVHRDHLAGLFRVFDHL